MRSEAVSPESRSMAELVDGLAEAEGINQTRLEGVFAMRSSNIQPRRPVVYTPSVVIVAQGRKVGYVGEAVHVYDSEHFLVLSVPMPFECEIAQASPEAPFLGLSVRVDALVLSQLVLDLEQVEPEGPSISAVCSSRLPEELRSAAVRLLECLHSEADSRILGPQIVREIFYRVLRSEQGTSLRALAGVRGSFGQIARALQVIHADYRNPLDVESLARTANMSVSAFHQHFKTVTDSSPIQYLKSIRLHKARMLMAKAGMNAKSAAGEVGYVSPSQFSREFKRFFGSSPAEESAKMRDIAFPRQAARLW